MACDSKRARHSRDYSPGLRHATKIQPTADERIAEIAEILAAGLMRLRARKSSELLSTGAGFFLGSLARPSGATPPQIDAHWEAFWAPR
jgi:hypothetical protein